MPANFFLDPLLSYAAAQGQVEPELISLFRQDRRGASTETARKTFELFRQAAERGSGFAMCACSRFCKIGWGVAPSNEDAISWALKAANVGFAPGHYELGVINELGIGVPISLEIARKHYESAAEGGFGFASLRLAHLCKEGRFGERDSARALQYAKQAHDLGDSMAALEIAQWYEVGDGVIPNAKEALLWFERAAERGNFIASARLSKAYLGGELGTNRNVELAKKYEEMSEAQMGG